MFYSASYFLCILFIGNVMYKTSQTVLFSPKFALKKTFLATNEFQAFASFPNSASPSLRHHVLWMLFKANQFQPECQIPATGCSKALLRAQNCFERPLLIK